MSDKEIKNTLLLHISQKMILESQKIIVSDDTLFGMSQTIHSYYDSNEKLDNAIFTLNCWLVGNKYNK